MRYGRMFEGKSINKIFIDHQLVQKIYVVYWNTKIESWIKTCSYSDVTWIDINHLYAYNIIQKCRYVTRPKWKLGSTYGSVFWLFCLNQEVVWSRYRSQCRAHTSTKCDFTHLCLNDDIGGYKMYERAGVIHIFIPPPTTHTYKKPISRRPFWIIVIFWIQWLIHSIYQKS